MPRVGTDCLLAAAARAERRWLSDVGLPPRRSGAAASLAFRARFLVCCSLLSCPAIAATQIPLVAAAHFYGDVAGPIEARIAARRGTFAGTPVTASEPVFGDMLAAPGMRV